ncbi:helix-turn-helix domain-containing protein [Chryseobacterium sp. Alg-005]|uniref:helix-turn-helix domain-containing protein n=1 Tax=Chryseobacterium sp. Alg-005 TaxID=3159516 RepID=UPI003555B8B0
MEPLTKEDLRQFKMQLLHEIEMLLDKKIKPAPNNLQPEWIRSKSVRRFLDISPATLQNIRITGKIRFKKVSGSYYYNFEDLKKLFESGKS